MFFETVYKSVQGKLGLEIKIRDHPRTHFGTTNPIVVLDLENELPLEIIFFEVSLIISIFMNCSNLIFEALFWKPSIPLNLC